jgi:hypothetical protein
MHTVLLLPQPPKVCLGSQTALHKPRSQKEAHAHPMLWYDHMSSYSTRHGSHAISMPLLNQLYTGHTLIPQ